MPSDGRRWFAEMEIDLNTTRSGPLTRRCVDWSERRGHLGGHLGMALATRLLELQWLVQRREERALRLTERGRQMFRRMFSLEFQKY